MKENGVILSIELVINEKLFQANPQRTALGRKILYHSVLMIDELGIERFTFRKLAERLDCKEPAIYRYFENKHMLLLYLVNWYWEWLRFRIEMKTTHLKNPQEKLNTAISCIVDTAKRNTDVAFIDEDVLHRIVVAEGTKAYHNAAVDAQNAEGFFLSYKMLSETLASIILENNPQFPYPRALASNLLEMANNHIYFAQHLPRLTDIPGDERLPQRVEALLLFFAHQMLGL